MSWQGQLRPSLRPVLEILRCSETLTAIAYLKGNDDTFRSVIWASPESKLVVHSGATLECRASPSCVGCMRRTARLLTVRSQLSYISRKLSYPAMGGMVGW